VTQNTLESCERFCCMFQLFNSLCCVCLTLGREQSHDLICVVQLVCLLTHKYHSMCAHSFLHKRHPHYLHTCTRAHTHTGPREHRALPGGHELHAREGMDDGLLYGAPQPLGTCPALVNILTCRAAYQEVLVVQCLNKTPQRCIPPRLARNFSKYGSSVWTSLHLQVT